MKLRKKTVAKPWGQRVLPDVFGGERAKNIGEIWFQPPASIMPALMVKYLFTSERLSIQVHPDNRMARNAGLPSGKDECWLVLDAEADAVLGIGPKTKASDAKLRAAAALGEIENLIDWKPAKPGDFYYIPAGTVHAIGPGLQLLEIQQNVDVTYRLYDYGRPRELHLDEAIAAAKAEPYRMKFHQHVDPDTSMPISDGPYFRTFQVVGPDIDLISNVPASEWQIIPLQGSVKVRGKLIKAGECGLCTSVSEIDLSKNEKCIIATNMK
ncbi:MAG: class I mannose-6-phosphate isomerase [Parasphingorhabdus sp.]